MPEAAKVAAGLGGRRRVAAVEHPEPDEDAVELVHVDGEGMV